MSFLAKVSNLDRRWIFIMIALSVLLAAPRHGTRHHRAGGDADSE